MSVVTSIFIPHFEKTFDPNYLAMTLDKLGVAKVSKIALETYPKSDSHHINYQKAYIDIKAWHETEAAYNFIQRLKNPNIEARINHSDDNWWSIQINKFPHKTAFSNKLRSLTIFEEAKSYPSYEEYDSDGSYDTAEDYDSDGEQIQWITLPEMDQEVYHSSSQFISYLSAVSTHRKLMDQLIDKVGEKEYLKLLKRQNYRKWMDYDEVNPFDEIQEKADAKLAKMYLKEIYNNADAEAFDDYAREIDLFRNESHLSWNDYSDAAWEHYFG